MKKTVLLIRHSRPDLPDGSTVCLGRNTDIGICREGRVRAEALADKLHGDIENAGVIYSSPLKRALETAKIISSETVPVKIREGLTEMDTGDWDGLTFDEIRNRYPEIYERRGADLSIPPPGGEAFPEAFERMRRTLKDILLEDERETVIAVSHSGSMRAFVCGVRGIGFDRSREIKAGYTSLITIRYDTVSDMFECINNCNRTGLDL